MAHRLNCSPTAAQILPSSISKLRNASSRRCRDKTRPSSRHALPEALDAALALPTPTLALSAFDATTSFDAAVSDSLRGLSPFTYALVLAAGLASSLSPCTLSVIPLTIGYIGGYNNAADASAGGPRALPRAAAFGVGVATTLTLLGVASTQLGSVYGQAGGWLPIAVGAIALLMGLNLLEVLPLRFPSLDLDVRDLPFPPLLTAFAAGLTFALAASPCSTPILATLLAYASAQAAPAAGASLLFVYSLGYVAPLLVAASATEAMKRVVGIRKYSAWLTPASGVLLLAGGTFTILTRVV